MHDLVRQWKELSQTIQIAGMQALYGRRVDDETVFWAVLYQHVPGWKIANRLKLTGYNKKQA